eukprot:Em0005g335a
MLVVYGYFPSACHLLMMLINYWARLRTVCDAAKLSKVLSLATVSMPAHLVLTIHCWHRFLLSGLRSRPLANIPIRNPVQSKAANNSLLPLHSLLHVQGADPPVPLPTFDSDCKLPGCTVQHIPVKDRLAFALALCSALQDNSEDAWLKPCLPPDFDIMALLHSFPKDTACGPSGLHIQHLIEASEVPLQFPICAVLRVVVNLLISGKVPVQVARFLAGDNLVALEKNKPNCPPDIRPIAVGEAIRHLAGKCLCVITKEKAHDFLAPLA